MSEYKEEVAKDLSIREANEQDRNFILRTWLKNYKQSHFARSIAPEIYFKKHETKIKDVMSRSKVIILCDKEKPWFICGFIILEEYTEANVVHFLYIRKSQRKGGFAKSLHRLFLKDKVLFYTQQCVIKTPDDRFVDISKELAEKVGAIYDPYLFFR